jgi:hypothetical protein
MVSVPTAIRHDWALPTIEVVKEKRAEECLRLAGACLTESNRQILLYAAVHWRMLAEKAAGASGPSHRPKSNEADPAPSDLQPSPRGS